MVVNFDQANRMMLTGSQPSNKGKEKKQETMAKRGRKQFGGTKGKAKVIATGHKMTQKSIWMKRVSGATKEGQKGHKRPKGAVVEDLNMEAEATSKLKGEGNTAALELERKKEDSEAVTAELGDDQLHQGK